MVVSELPNYRPKTEFIFRKKTMNAPQFREWPPPLGVYPCGPEIHWVLYPGHLAVYASRSHSSPLFTLWLKDLHGIDYKEPGLTSGAAQIIPSDQFPRQGLEEDQLIFSLDPRYKSHRQEFLRTLSDAAPHVTIRAMNLSPEKSLMRRNRAVELETSRLAAEIRRTEREETKKARQEEGHARFIEQTLIRPDGSRAPTPVAVVGSVWRLHLRLYPDCLVFVDRRNDKRQGAPYEKRLPISELEELQWAKLSNSRCYLAPPPADRRVHGGIEEHPMAVLCAGEELDSALQAIAELYPNLAVRQVARLDRNADPFNGWEGGRGDQIESEWALVPGFTPDKRVVGVNRVVFALDVGQSKLVVIDGGKVARSYDPADLLSVEVFEDGQSIARAHRAAKGGNKVALAGFLLGDGFSTLAGLAAANRPTPRDVIHEMGIRLEIDDPAQPIAELKLFQTRSHPIQKGSSRHRSLSSEARSWASLISAMIRRAADFDDGGAAAQQAPTAPQGVATELAQLAKLRADGVLSEDEFTQLKSRLIQGG